MIKGREIILPFLFAFKRLSKRRLYFIIKYMFYCITGKVIHYEEGKLVVQAGGVGYELLVSNNALTRLGKIGLECTVYTTLSVTQDDVRLFGFYSKEEKNMFQKLTSVSGVGGKMALQILSSADVSMLAVAIVSGDTATISKVKGIGKKTAERIILELREQMNDAVVSAGSASDLFTQPEEKQGGVASDAIAALVSLGISKTDAYSAVANAMKKTDKLEQIITLALRSFDR